MDGKGANNVASFYKLRQVTLDGAPRWKFTCPGCGVEGYLDDDQFHGRVSTLCGECDRFHKTIDFSQFVGPLGMVKPPDRGWGKDVAPEMKRDRLEQLAPSAQPEVDVDE